MNARHDDEGALGGPLLRAQRWAQTYPAAVSMDRILFAASKNKMHGIPTLLPTDIEILTSTSVLPFDFETRANYRRRSFRPTLFPLTRKVGK